MAQNDNKNMDQESDLEFNGEYDTMFEDLQQYIEELEAHPEATTGMIESEEAPKVDEDHKK